MVLRPNEFYISVILESSKTDESLQQMQLLFYISVILESSKTRVKWI